MSYVFDTGTSITVQSEMIFEWRSEAWSIPVNLGLSQVFSVGPLFRMSAGLQGKWWRSPAGPDWGFRVITTLLFPERTGPQRSAGS